MILEIVGYIGSALVVISMLPRFPQHKTMVLLESSNNRHLGISEKNQS